MLRSYLYVPADRPDRFDKALASAADAVIIDLEDGVAAAEKCFARENAATWISANPGGRVWVRVNNHADLLASDLEMVRDSAPTGVVMPKATLEACAVDHVAIMALVETAEGVLALAELARLDSVVRIALGEADLGADLGVDPSPDARELAAVRSQVVVASAAAGLPAPCGPVHTDLADLDGLAVSTEALRRQGFSARSAIHPDQIAVINEAFTPSASEIERAREVVAAFDAAIATGKGVATIDGKFVDAAVVRYARRILGQP